MKMKRIISMLLCAVMLIGILPMAAWAGETQPCIEVAGSTSVSGGVFHYDHGTVQVVLVQGESEHIYDGTDNMLALDENVTAVKLILIAEEGYQGILRTGGNNPAVPEPEVQGSVYTYGFDKSVIAGANEQGFVSLNVEFAAASSGEGEEQPPEEPQPGDGKGTTIAMSRSNSASGGSFAYDHGTAQVILVRGESEETYSGNDSVIALGEDVTAVKIVLTAENGYDGFLHIGGGALAVPEPAVTGSVYTYTFDRAEIEDLGFVDFVPEFSEGAADPIQACRRDESCPAAVFTDVALDQWYHDGIHFCLDNGLMNGTGTTTFAPNETAARAMLVTVLYRLEDKPQVGESPFTDIPAGEWYSDAVTWAAENKIVEGYNGYFQPEDDITREQFAAILYRYARNYKGMDVSARADLSSFADGSETSGWAQDAMSWAVAEGIFHGKEGNRLDPGGKTLRSEMATILYRFCGMVAA